MALPQQGTETRAVDDIIKTDPRFVLMALPQQGTETLFYMFLHFISPFRVNGLTPTGDGNFGV